MYKLLIVALILLSGCSLNDKYQPAMTQPKGKVIKLNDCAELCYHKNLYLFCETKTKLAIAPLFNFANEPEVCVSH